MKKDDCVLTREDQKLLTELEQMPEEEIDVADIPEVLEVRNPRRGAYSQPTRTETEKPAAQR